MNHRDSPDILEKLKWQRDLNSKLYITVPETPLRTLLLMGPSRAGKSTISETLQDSLHEPNEPTLYSCTRHPDPKQINGLRIIDMPGFNDIQTRNRTSSSSLSNKSIIKMLQMQLRERSPVHHVAFVFSLADGIKQEDINAMIFVQSNFPELTERMMLVVTHAEELNHEEKEKLIKEFFQHPRVKQYHLRNFFQQGILFLGCLRYESYHRLDYSALLNEHQNVLEMRKKFIEKCFAQIPSINHRQFHNKPSSHFSATFLKNCVVSIIIALLCYITCTAVRPVTLIDTDLNSTITIDAPFNSSMENQTDSYNSTDFKEEDIVFNSTENHGLTLFELSQTTNEILKEILLEMRKLNQRFQNLEKTQEKFDRRLEHIEHLLAEYKF